jgi:hypothetical protein
MKTKNVPIIFDTSNTLPTTISHNTDTSNTLPTTSSHTTDTSNTILYHLI